VGTFIEIRLDPSTFGPEQARRLVSACPVDIYAVEAGQPVVQPDEVDECTLCELCLDLAAPGAIVIRKLYKDQDLVSRGPEVER
jgi:ferredoxin-like protein FixX